MKSYTGTSKLELSPGAINPDDLYQSPNPYHNPYKEHEEQLSAVQEENLRLKTSLAHLYRHIIASGAIEACRDFEP